MIVSLIYDTGRKVWGLKELWKIKINLGIY